MSVTGIHGTESMDSGQVTIRISAIDKRTVAKIFQVDINLDIEIGYKKIDYKESKRSYKHMWPLPNQFLSMNYVGITLGQDVFCLIRPLEYKSGGLVTPGQYEFC